MKTHLQPPSGPRTGPTSRLRRLSALAVVPVVALAACSGEAPLTTAPTATGTIPASTSSTTPAPTATSDATTPAGTPTTSAPAPVTVPVKVAIKDPVLGHVVSFSQVKRNQPWPAGHPVASQQFEIVAVRVKVVAGKRYSASLSPAQLTLKLGSSYVPSTTEFGKAFPDLLTTAKRGETKRGWLIFKIDRDVHPLTIEYRRPAYEVSTTDKSIPAKVFRAKLVD